MSADHRAVEALLHRYADAIDAGDLAGLGALFAHGRIRGVTPTGTVDLAAGAQAVESFYRGLVRIHDDGTPRTRHITTNVTIEVDDAAGTATAAASFTVFQATDVLPLQAIVVGRYRDTFHRVDGEWWFETRTMTSELTGDLSQHLRR